MRLKANHRPTGGNQHFQYWHLSLSTCFVSNDNNNHPGERRAISAATRPDVKIQLTEIFQSPTIKELSKTIKDAIEDKHVSIQPEDGYGEPDEDEDDAEEESEDSAEDADVENQE